MDEAQPAPALNTSIVEEQSDDEDDEEDHDVEIHEDMNQQVISAEEKNVNSTETSKRHSLRELKTRESTVSRRQDGRKNLKRANKVNVNMQVSSKKSKQMSRRQGKHAGMGGKRCGW